MFRGRHVEKCWIVSHDSYVLENCRWKLDRPIIKIIGNLCLINKNTLMESIKNHFSNHIITVLHAKTTSVVLIVIF